MCVCGVYVCVWCVYCTIATFLKLKKTLFGLEFLVNFDKLFLCVTILSGDTQ